MIFIKHYILIFLIYLVFIIEFFIKCINLIVELLITHNYIKTAFIIKVFTSYTILICYLVLYTIILFFSFFKLVLRQYYPNIKIKKIILQNVMFYSVTFFFFYYLILLFNTSIQLIIIYSIMLFIIIIHIYNFTLYYKSFTIENSKILLILRVLNKIMNKRILFRKYKILMLLNELIKKL
jgi:hypothetical protein